MTRVKLLGDHSLYHCGAAAVWQVILNWADRNGLRQVSGDDFDVLIVNGEGSMHHGRPTFHRKMRELEASIRQGKPAFLVNTLWQSNPPDYNKTLAALSGVYVRDALSAEDLLLNHHRRSQQSIDLSYFAPVIATTETRNFDGAMVRTDFYSRAVGDFVEMGDPALAALPTHALKDTTWSAYVSSLRTASLLVTGRHHAVYAACRARTPFAAMEGNSHKIRGLVRSAGIEIPIGDDEGDLPLLIEWAKTNLDSFERLFDWMEAQATNGSQPIGLPQL